MEFQLNPRQIYENDIDENDIDQECSNTNDAASIRCKLEVQELRNLLSFTRQAMEMIEMKMDAINTLQQQEYHDEYSTIVEDKSAVLHRAELVAALADAREADMKHGLCSEPSNIAWTKVDALYVHQKQVEEEMRQMKNDGSGHGGCIAVPQPVMDKLRKLRGHYTVALDELEGNVLDLEHNVLEP